MSESTQHGENIANEINGEDAYGNDNDLTLADVWLILDNLQSKFIDQEFKPNEIDIVGELGKWMRQLEKVDEDLPL